MSSSSPASNAETITVSDTVKLLNINMTNVTKLTASNFLMWSRQVHALLDGYDLAGHLDGSVIIPPPTNTVDGVTTPNPEYTLRKRQDKLIYSALLGAITVTIQPILSTATTSNHIWETLSETYAKPSRAYVKQIRQQLKTWTKGTTSIDVYVQGFITRFDQLALLGKPIDIEDQLEYVLEGLPEDYKQVIDAIKGRDSPPSLTEVHEKLLNHEVNFKAKACCHHLPSPRMQLLTVGTQLVLTTMVATTIMGRTATTTTIVTNSSLGRNNKTSLPVVISLLVAIRVAAKFVLSKDTALDDVHNCRALLTPPRPVLDRSHQVQPHGNHVLIWLWHSHTIQIAGSSTVAPPIISPLI